MSQPPYPPQPPPFPSAIKFTVQGNVMSSNLVAPALTIDGQRAPAPNAGGSTVIPVPPGQHRLEAYSQWMRQYGQASLDVSVPPHAMVEVFYAPPYHQFTTGAMGLTAQPRKGMTGLVVVLAVVVVLIILFVVASLL